MILDRTEHLDITVAALTRGRRGMLSDLIDSFERIKVPDLCTVRFLVVENDDQPKSKAEIDKRGGRLTTGHLDYVLETELGIPFGRNRAARESISNGR